MYTLFESENERQKIEPFPILLPRASRKFPDVKTWNYFLTAILHLGLKNDFFFFEVTSRFHILFGLLFPFSFWTFISLFYLDFYFETFRDISKHIETYRDISRHFETFWDILRHFETFRDISRHFETYPDILRHFETFQDISRHFDLFRSFQSRSDFGFLPNFFHNWTSEIIPFICFGMQMDRT